MTFCSKLLIAKEIDFDRNKEVATNNHLVPRRRTRAFDRY